MTGSRRFVLGVVLFAFGTAGALAETAYTVRTVNLRAGPSREFPIVTRLPPDTPVEVAGCLDDWTWCDVIADLDRGWVYAGHLEYPYGDSRVPIIRSGAEIGLPIVVFSVGPYWDNYYRGRPWYSRRSYWEHRRWVHSPAPAYHPPVARPPASRPGSRPPIVVRPRPVERPPVRPLRPMRPAPQPVRPAPQPVRPAPPPPRPAVARPEAHRPPPAKPNVVRPEKKRDSPRPDRGRKPDKN